MTKIKEGYKQSLVLEGGSYVPSEAITANYSISDKIYVENGKTYVGAVYLSDEEVTNYPTWITGDIRIRLG